MASTLRLCLWLSPCVKRRCHWEHRGPGPGVASTNHAEAERRSTNYTPAVRTEGGEAGMWGSKRGCRWRRDMENLNRAVLTGMASRPFSINSGIFVVEWITDARSSFHLVPNWLLLSTLLLASTLPFKKRRIFTLSLTNVFMPKSHWSSI